MNRLNSRGDKSGNVDPGRGGVLPARGGPGVQVGGVDHPRDERHRLLGVPAPEPAHADSAHTAPRMTPRPNSGKPKTTDL